MALELFAPLAALFSLLITALLLYVVIRIGVRHGVGDALRRSGTPLDPPVGPGTR